MNRKPAYEGFLFLKLNTVSLRKISRAIMYLPFMPLKLSRHKGLATVRAEHAVDLFINL
jgi:hypothetical protein